MEIGARTTAELDPARDPPPELGRYLLTDRLGEGGMGAVFAAWDRELERKVAVKILRGDDHARSVREALALARLNHPNVVRIFDVGAIDGYDYIVMELVDGMSLRAWLETPRPWRDVVAAFRDAGRGLAAAHAAGLVHRDFKPDNVLVARDGTVQVADFGLARAPLSADDTGAAPSGLLHGTLTRPGFLPGTPRYMTPEQRVGATPHPTMDQYSFCFAMWEALFACSPDGEAMPDLQPATGRVPARLRAALKRGTSIEPDDRFPSMEALLDVLTRALRRRGAIAAVVAGGAVVVAAFAIAFALRGGGAADPCGGGDAKLAGVWDDGARHALAGAFAASGRGFAVDAAARATALLDARADAWVGMRRDACEATSVRHDQSDALLDLRMACLDRRLGEMRALVGVLAHADASAVDNAVSAVHALPDEQACADASALLADPTAAPADPIARGQAAAVRAEVAEAKALVLAGHYKDALRAAEAATALARTIGSSRVLGEALVQLGQVRERLYDDRAGEAAFQEAVVALAAAKADTDVIDAWMGLVATVGVGQSRIDEAMAYRRGAEAALARAPDPEREAGLDRQLGLLLKLRGDFAGALAMQQRALALQRGVHGPDDLRLASTHVSIGNLERQLGHLDDALAEHRTALEMFSRLEGAQHPDVGGARVNIASVFDAQGRTADSLEELDRARDILESALGPDAADLGLVLHNRACTYLELERDADAIADFTRALAIREAKSPGSLGVASSLRGMGIARLRTGQLDDARASLARALAIFEAKLGATSPRVAEMLIPLADVAIARGDLAEATALLARAKAVAPAGGEAAGDDVLAQLATSNARLALRQGRGGDAIAGARRALALTARWSPAGHPAVRKAQIFVGEALLASPAELAQLRVYP